MDESAFNAMADAELDRIELALERCGVDIDIERKDGGVLELEFDNGTKMVLNRHGIAREIWVAAKSGGFHFRREPDGWIAGRDGAELYATLSRLVSEQSGTSVTVTPG